MMITKNTICTDSLLIQEADTKMLDALNNVYDDFPTEENAHLDAIYTEFSNLMADEGW